MIKQTQVWPEMAIYCAQHKKMRKVVKLNVAVVHDPFFRANWAFVLECGCAFNIDFDERQPQEVKG